MIASTESVVCTCLPSVRNLCSTRGAWHQAGPSLLFGQMLTGRHRPKTFISARAPVAIVIATSSHSLRVLSSLFSASFLGGASRSSTLFKNLRPWVVCVWWVAVPSRCGPSVFRWHSTAQPGPPLPSASSGVTLAGGVAWPCVRRARPPFPSPFLVAPRVPFPLYKDLRPGVVCGTGVVVVGVSPRTARAAPPGWAPQLVPLLPLAGRALSA